MLVRMNWEHSLSLHRGVDQPLKLISLYQQPYDVAHLIVSADTSQHPHLYVHEVKSMFIHTKYSTINTCTVSLTL